MKPFKSASRAASVSASATASKYAAVLGVPLAYLYADSSDLAEVILAFGLLTEPERRRLTLELKARVSPPATKPCPARRAPAVRRPR